MLRWLFLDMDNYFASVEQQDRPALRGRPVGVLPVMSEGTCCIAASTEAKRRGVKTGTGVPEARRLCPDIQLVEARPDHYVEVHHRILECVGRVAPVDRVESIDEVAVRLMGDERRPAGAASLAGRIKAAVREEIGEYLTCSVGAAPSRLLAKIASELGKPDGRVVLRPDDLPGALSHLAMTDLPGINTGMQVRLHRHGVHTVGDLWRLSMAQAEEVWGSVEGRRYCQALHGEDPGERPNRRRSFGHANVLAPELRTDVGAHGVMTRLLHKAAARLRHHGYFAHALHAGVRYESGARWSDAIDLPACQDTLTVIQHFERLWARRPTVGIPKHVSITLGGLTPAGCTPGYLFDAAAHRRQLGGVMDRINRKYGGHTVYLGGMHDVARREMPDKIAFGRVPDEAVKM